jgi:cobalt ECF transporter T component CbiQ
VETGEFKRKTAVLPQWMLCSDQNHIDNSGKTKTGFLRETLSQISGVFQNEILAERFAASDGLLQRLDARVKLVSILFFMVYAGLSKKLLTLLLLASVAAMMAVLSKLHIRTYIRRVWLFLPVIILVFSVPAATSLIIRGTPLVYIYRDLNMRILFIEMPRELYFSKEGILAVLKLVTRIGVSISFGYVLIMTTRWSKLARALAILRIPKLFITILDMTYRYIFVLSRLVVEIFEARYLRTVGKVRGRDNRKFLAGGMAHLLTKSVYLSQEVYDSMICRGFTGEPVALDQFRLTRNDFVWIANSIIIAIILFILQ